MSNFENDSNPVGVEPRLHVFGLTLAEWRISVSYLQLCSPLTYRDSPLWIDLNLLNISRIFKILPSFPFHEEFYAINLLTYTGYSIVCNNILCRLTADSKVPDTLLVLQKHKSCIEMGSNPFLCDRFRCDPNK